MRALWILLLVAGCSAADPDLGLRAAVRVEGAQFVAGPMPGDSGGPSTRALSAARPTLPLGVVGVGLFVTLGPTATAAWVGVDGDAGYFVVLAGAPDTETPDSPSLRASLAVAPNAVAGPRVLAVRAVDEAGHAGPRAELGLELLAPTIPIGLLFVLAWDGPADLDLHVVDPHGDEVWARHPVVSDGALMIDAHSGCVDDGLQSEQAQFAGTGHYIARVDAFSLCGAGSAPWTLSVYVDGTLRDRASGTALPTDTRGPHERGAGLSALTFDLQ